MIVFAVIIEVPTSEKLDGTLPATNMVTTIIYRTLEKASAENEWKGKVVVDPGLIMTHVVELFTVGEILVLDTATYKEVGRGRAPSAWPGVRYEVHETVEEAVRRSREITAS